MAKPTQSEKVPEAMQETCDRITAITDDLAAQPLNSESA